MLAISAKCNHQKESTCFLHSYAFHMDSYTVEFVFELCINFDAFVNYIRISVSHRSAYKSYLYVFYLGSCIYKYLLI